MAEKMMVLKMFVDGWMVLVLMVSVLDTLADMWMVGIVLVLVLVQLVLMVMDML